MSHFPWSRQQYDTDESWVVFQIFRDQVPPRRGLSIGVKGKALNPVQVSIWMRDHYWRERCLEYDRHLDEIRCGERDKLLAQKSSEIAAEHMSFLANTRDIVGREFEKLKATVAESAGEVLTTRDLIRMMESVVKLDRLVRGESTEIVQEQSNDLSHLTDEELTQLESLLKKP